MTIILKARDVGDGAQQLLERLFREDAELGPQQKSIDARRKEIRDKVVGVLGELGGTDARVIALLESGDAWDRRVSNVGAGLNTERLKEAVVASIGIDGFHKLLCDKAVTYTLSPTKLVLARESGKLTEAVLKGATDAGEKRPSLYRLAPKDVKKVEDEGPEMPI